MPPTNDPEPIIRQAVTERYDKEAATVREMLMQWPMTLQHLGDIHALLKQVATKVGVPTS